MFTRSVVWSLLPLVLVLPPISTFAEAASLCEEANIRELHFEGFSRYESERDYCQAAHLPEEATRLLNQISDLHQRTANFLKTSAPSLFPKGIALTLRSQPTAALASEADNTQITMGVLPEWKGETIDPGVYLHELGHFLTGNSYPSDVLPQMFRELRRSTLGTETIADYLSYQIVGQVSFPIPGFPECYWSIRPIDRSESYDRMPQGIFQFWENSRKSVQCCQKADLTRFERFREICEKNSGYFSSIPPVDSSPFDPGKVKGPLYWGTAYTMEDYDPHLIGVPVNAFLMNLKEQTHSLSPRFLVDAMSRIADNPSGVLVYRCRLTGWETSIQVRVSSLREVFRSIRSQLPEGQERSTFDILWQRHGMETGMRIFDKDADEMALYEARQEFIRQLYSRPQHPCYSLINDRDYWTKRPEACAISCSYFDTE